MNDDEREHDPDANHLGTEEVKRSKKIKMKGKDVAKQVDLARQMWLTDGENSLRQMLLNGGALAEAFYTFVKLEGGDSECDFYKEVARVKAIEDEDEQESAATELYERYLGDVKDGIGQQQRTGDTAKLYKSAKKKKVKSLSADKMLKALDKEAEKTLRGLSFSAFPRFVKSKACKQAMKQLSAGSSGGNEELLAQSLEAAGSKLPQDADEWLNTFITLAETWPACIVISDMSIPGAPMVYVNPEFCRVTEYTKEDAVGRNCRFLQGPDTEPEAIAVIQQTLSKGEDCHVLLTNYRRSGKKFKNLLSMRPVFDADGLYRYVIGVQFEVDKSGGEPSRLAQLNKLLQLLPTKLELRSSATARKRGLLATDVKGAPPKNEENSEALEDAKKAALAEMGETGEPRDWSKAVFGLTRVMWLENGAETMKGLMSSKKTAQTVLDFAKANHSPTVVQHVTFMMEALSVAAGDNDALRALFMRRHHNSMFYCTRQEIVYGELDLTDWDEVSAEVNRAAGTSAKFLATDFLPSMMHSSVGVALVKAVRKSEGSGGSSPKKKKKKKKNSDGASTLATVASGVSEESASSDRHWLELFGNMASTFGEVGLVVSDMRVPGIPLAFVNEGFAKTTGWSKEWSTGKKCSFLQGEETQGYLIEEIVAALRESKPLVTKIVNYKKDGSLFQCLLGLHPVFNDDGEYLYQVGVQIDMSMKNTAKLCEQLASFERLMDLLPTGLSCAHANDKRRNMIPKSTTSDVSFMALPAPVEYKLSAEASAEAPVVETGTGANKDQYGKKFGKKHKNVLQEMSRSAWLTDANRSLEMLLDTKTGRKAFGTFLEAEYNKAALDFYLAVKDLDKLSGDDQETAAAKVFKDYMGSPDAETKKKGKGIGAQDRTKATDKLWNKNSKNGDVVVKKRSMYVTVKKESADTFRMLVVESFPRFLDTKHAKALNKPVAGEDKASQKQLKEALERAGSTLPQNADDWLKGFVGIAETWPACIVVSDMSISGAPMVYVNPEFCRVTEYDKEDAVGRNCRFLQGPDTEPEAIGVIQRTLSKGEDCHVLLTNYRKSGEKFKNLLSMRPVFDADGVYRYVIGVQFEVIEDEALATRMKQLDKLLGMLPRQLPFRSVKKVATTPLAKKNTYTAPTNDEHLHSVFAATKAKWLLSRQETMVSMMDDNDGAAAFGAFAKEMGGPMTQSVVNFLTDTKALAAAKSAQKKSIARDLHLKMGHNDIFYCTQTEITIGKIDEQDWGVLGKGVEDWRAHWANILGETHLAAFLDSKYGGDLLQKVSRRELKKPSKKGLTSPASGLATDSPTFWLEMMRNIGTSLPDVGMVISDMRTPGIPLALINEEGFAKVTGYGREMEMQKCTFLQGKGTEDYLVEEIVDSLRGAVPLVVKLTNYKKGGDMFRCLLVLAPIFDTSGEYVYSIGMQLDADNQSDDPDDERYWKQLSLVSTVTGLMPKAKIGHLPPPSTKGAGIVKTTKQKTLGGSADDDEDDVDAADEDDAPKNSAWPTPRGGKSLSGGKKNSKRKDNSDEESEEEEPKPKPKKNQKKPKKVDSDDEDDDEEEKPKSPSKLRKQVAEAPDDEAITPSRPKGPKTKGASLPSRISEAEIAVLGEATKGPFMPRLQALEEACGINDPPSGVAQRIAAIEEAIVNM